MAMKLSKHALDELFSVEENFSCDGIGGNALRIVSINEDFVHVQAALPGSSPAVLKYDAISAAIASGSAGDLPAGGMLRCFVAEYLRRAEQARRDAEVDAMWQKAGACQL